MLKFNLFKIIILLLFLFYYLIFALNEEKYENQNNISDFDVIDKNADGLISYGEFQSWHRIALGAEPKQSAAIFGIYDLDKDGKLSVTEFVPLAFELSRKPVKESEKVFQKFDSNSDGFLNINELKSEKISDSIIIGLFDVSDVNNDGLISKKEFSSVADSFESHLSKIEENAGQAQSLIAALDLDNDGKINIKELITHQNRFGKIKDNNNINDDINLAVSQLDINEDSFISFEELKQLPQIIMKAAGIQPFIL